MKYNQTICDFLIKNGIDIFNIPKEVNKELTSPAKETILSHYLYSISSSTKVESVNIGNLCGSDTLENFHALHSVSLLDSLEDYFDREGDGYHRRSVGLLEYSEEEIIDRLESSFERDPIHLTAIEDKLYVTINGNHRSLILLFHYLNSMMRHPEKRQELDYKFQISAYVNHLNLSLSGIVFLLKMKYGSIFKMNSSVIRNGVVNFSIGEKVYQMSEVEFLEFSREELSKKTCSFFKLRELYTVALTNSLRDPHFKVAMESIFEGLSKMDVRKVTALLKYTIGLEEVLEQMTDENVTFMEYMEMVKETVFDQKMEELRNAVDFTNQVRKSLEQLDLEQKRIEDELKALDSKEAEAEFYRQVLEKDREAHESENYDILEHEEQQLLEQVSILQRKKIVFRKRKKLNDLNHSLQNIREQLDQSNFWEYQGKSISKRQFHQYVKEANGRSEVDFRAIKIELHMQLFDIKNKKMVLSRKKDCYYNIVQFKRFCEECGFDFKKSMEEIGWIDDMSVMEEKKEHQL